MSAESSTNRWWEYYAVRYLMPSIAGVAIVNWLCSYAGGGFRQLLSLPIAGVDAPSLILLFLYGNLFCYVASYPVLVFHATRAIQFANAKWPGGYPWCDGYITSAVLATLSVILLLLFSPVSRYWIAFGSVLIYVILQMARLFVALFPRVALRGASGPVSPAYGYAYALSRRRGKPVRIEDQEPASAFDGENSAGADDEGATLVQQDAWRREFMDTYRHMREHGNSAFIFLLEFALAGLALCVLGKPGQSPARQLSTIGMLFALWSLPAVFVHLLGQHLERRFSHYDRRLGTG